MAERRDQKLKGKENIETPTKRLKKSKSFMPAQPFYNPHMYSQQPCTMACCMPIVAPHGKACNPQHGAPIPRDQSETFYINNITNNYYHHAHQGHHPQHYRGHMARH